MNRSSLIVGTALGVGAVLVGGWLVSTTWETRDEIPRSAFLPNADGDPFLMTGAQDASREICDASILCEWAVRSDTLTVLKFDDHNEARRAASSMPNSRRSNWIVVEFSRDGASDAEKDEFMDFIDGLHTSE